MGLDVDVACCTHSHALVQIGGSGGIRTPGTLSGTSVFKTAAIDLSATLPQNPFAEPMGFEPMAPLSRCARFPSGCLKPLGQSSAKGFSFHSFVLAGRPGFEPELTGSEPVVLPLNYHPTRFRIHAGMQAWRTRRDSNPRNPCGFNRFRSDRFQPLSHPSSRLAFRHLADAASLKSRDPLSDIDPRLLRPGCGTVMTRRSLHLRDVCRVLFGRDFPDFRHPHYLN